MNKFDWRTPADPQDFETFMSRSPVPPINLSASTPAPGLGTGSVILTLRDYETAPGRGRNSGYRVYFLPLTAIGLSDVSKADMLQSAVKLATPVGEVRSVGNAGTVTLVDSLNIGVHGWYFATGLNRKGEESEATPPCASPN